jgi:hypothetical protein
MTQNFFGTLTSPSLPLLDANFLELFTGVTVIDNVFAQKWSSPSGKVRVAPYSTGEAGSFIEAVNGSESASIPILLFGSTVSIGTAGGGRVILNASGHFTPVTDNTKTCGDASHRFSVYYAGTGTINTSDAREKTAVTPLSPAEVSAAAALAKEIGTYQWLISVQEKGSLARRHVGMTVQRVIEVMEAHGLDPMAYGFICYDKWPEHTVPERVEHRKTGLKDELQMDLYEIITVEPAKIIPAGDRYSFRPDELLLFIARGFEARLAALEAAA